MFKSFFCIVCFLFFISCQPISYMETAGEEDLVDKTSSLGLASFRSSQDEFKDVFLSDKLDLVFVLDTNPYMESFYRKQLLSADFLNNFKDYDWRVAWTDMSVDTSHLSKPEKKKSPSCNFLTGLGFTVGGLALGAGSPVAVGFGINELSDCVSIGKKSNKPSEFTNGAFLPFERGRKKLEDYFLSRSSMNYNQTLRDTFQLGTKREKWGNSYDAPKQRKYPSHPFLSMALSLTTANSPSEDSQSEGSFFREDSTIVYVLITTKDMKVNLSAEDLKHSVESFVGSAERVRMIPITSSSLICNLSPQSEKQEDTPRLKELAKEMNSNSLDICSPNLSEELFLEISQSLYPFGFLSESVVVN